ncbi:MAG: hypothetical protein H6577_18080 [Lewinellaceae bacterium]|nr:hypothetical protein [Saprospiraceae bacterium]MCB9340035.1 hypothetical protein [Lewinellaceae bacterium]
MSAKIVSRKLKFCSAQRYGYQQVPPGTGRQQRGNKATFTVNKQATFALILHGINTGKTWVENKAAGMFTKL